MKKFSTIIAAALLFVASFNASAVKAYPYPIQVTQPDGSVVTIQLHGDEFHHWTTLDGQVVMREEDGFFRPVPEGSPMVRMASTPGISQRALMDPDPSINIGKHHFLVVLVQFQDVKFSMENPRQAFSELLNGAEGSVNDYYYENSARKFDPVFDVSDPVTVSNVCKYYGENDDAHASAAFWEACDRLKDEIDFSLYDINGDKIVDNVFFYYAGYNEAEGAEDTIWPHQSNMASAKKYDRTIGDIVIDGVSLGSYACSSELRGTSGKTMCGIGTFCHEFGHVLGLPDFYDTDYEESMGENYGMGKFSLMSSGNYNNNGLTPPALTAIERQIIGWTPAITEWKESGEKVIGDIMENAACMMPTRKDGEYFMFEVRGGNKWDSYIGSQVQGLLIYHVDRSTNRISGGVTAQSLWSVNKVNAYGGHPCCQVIPAAGSLDFNERTMTYPGYNNIRSVPSLTAWSGESLAMSVGNIVYSNTGVTLTLGTVSGKTFSGIVKDGKGNPVAGATVTVEPQTVSSIRPASAAADRTLEMTMITFSKASGVDDYSAVSSSDGRFSIDLSGATAVSDFKYTVSCHGYRDSEGRFELVAGTIDEDCIIEKIEVSEGLMEFRRFDGTANTVVSFRSAALCAIKYPAEDLLEMVGARIETVGFSIHDCTYSDLRVIIDFGDETVFEGRVESAVFNRFMRFDISSKDLRIPAGKDVYVGYYVDATDGNPFWVNSSITDNNGLFKRNLDSHLWTDYSSEGSLAIGFSLRSFNSQAYLYGFNGIANPKDGKYSAGEEFALELVGSVKIPDSVEWFFDGTAVEGASVELPSGEHEVKAILKFNSGRTETIVQVITAE